MNERQIPPLGLDPERTPRHVAFIMDGNGRWAEARGLPRIQGHRQGMQTIRTVLECAREWGIHWLTFYAFSTENWKRPREEVQFLFQLLENYLREEERKLHENEIQLRVIGDYEKLPSSLVQHLKRVIRETEAYQRWHLIVALSYGGRDEILRAIQRYLQGIKEPSGNDLDEVRFSQYLDTAGIPDPDLLIRTSGEQRISNFLLWQCAYTEFVFIPEYWPDFTAEVFHRALHEYARRDRRYGDIRKVSSPVSSSEGRALP